MAITKCLIGSRLVNRFTVEPMTLSYVWPHQRRMVRAAWMEKIMRKTHDTSKFDHAKPENRVLADSELNAVSGGMEAKGNEYVNAALAAAAAILRGRV